MRDHPFSHSTRSPPPPPRPPKVPMRRWSQALKQRNAPLEISDPTPIPTFETHLSSTPRGSRKIVFKGEAVLDYYAHRDIVDEILYFLPFKDVLRWRATCRELNAKLKLSRLSLRIRPVQKGDWCLLEVCTGGGILLSGWSCSYRSHAGDMYTDTRPKMRSVQGCKLLRQVDILGRCPHNSPVPCRFIRELEEQRHENSRALERNRQVTTWGNILRVNLFPDIEGNYMVDTQPEPGTVQFVVLCDNWRANPRSVPFRRTSGSKQAVIFVIDGREPGTTLLRTQIEHKDVSVLYDFSTWRPPPRDLTGWSLDYKSKSTRMSNLVAHAASVLRAGGHIHLLGLHRISSNWLDPHYPGDHCIPAPNHPDWHPLAVHVCSAILAHLTSREGQSFKKYVDCIHVVPQRVTLEEWADFVRPLNAGRTKLPYPHYN